MIYGTILNIGNLFKENYMLVIAYILRECIAEMLLYSIRNLNCEISLRTVQFTVK